MDTEDFRKRLLQMKKDLTHRISAIDRDIRHEGMSADWSEQASERENDEVLESLGNTSEQELLMIKYALRRIEDGSYFQCDECGKDIPPARLELLPFTARVADHLCVIRSAWTDAINHEPAMSLMHTGSQLPGRPSMGAWLGKPLSHPHCSGRGTLWR